MAADPKLQETNPQQYLLQLLNDFGSDNSKLTNEELTNKLSVLNALGKETRGGQLPTLNQTIINPNGSQSSSTPQTYAQVTSPQDTQARIQEIHDLMDQRNYEQSQNNLLDKTVSDLPGQLSGQTDQYLAGQQQQGQNYFAQELAPEIAQSSNARGLLYSGDFQSELSRGAGQVQGTLDQSQADLQAQDNQYFADIAYQNTYRKAISAGQDISADLGAARQGISNQKEQAFQSNQMNVNDQFQNLLFQRQQQRALMAQQAEYQNQQRQQQRTNQTNLVSGLTNAVGQIGGTAVAGPLGGAVGGAFAGGAGGLINS